MWIRDCFDDVTMFLLGDDQNGASITPGMDFYHVRVVYNGRLIRPIGGNLGSTAFESLREAMEYAHRVLEGHGAKLPLITQY